MSTQTSPNGASSASGPSNEQTKLLERILNRLDTIDARIARLEAQPPAASIPAELESIGAMLADIVDDRIRGLQAEGLDIDQTGQGLAALAKAAARPEVLGAAERLTNKLPELAKLAEDGPKLAAMVADTFDDLAVRAARQGFDLDRAIGSLLSVGLELSRVLESPQFRALFDSGVLAPETLEIVGRAGRALSEQSGSECGRTSLFGAVGASSNPDVQRALHFLIGVARRFGSEMACAPSKQLSAQR